MKATTLSRYRVLELLGKGHGRSVPGGGHDPRARGRPQGPAAGTGDESGAPGASSHPSRIRTWNSHVVLSAEFFEAITERPVPIDLRVLEALKSSLALDIYAWLTYRSNYLEKPCRISWQSLALQFGSRYSDVRDFRRKFLVALKRFLCVYPLARVRIVRGGLMRGPARPHAPKT